MVGPTASGKTEKALELAAANNAELISVDSRQIYEHLAIGTAKPEGKWVGRAYLVRGVPYHLVDFWDPASTFTAADFVRLALEKIHEIGQRGKKPILVGGTGLYFKALHEGLAPLPPADPKTRARLKQEAEDRGREHLHRRLAQVDPEAAAKIPANNIQRLVRALEVYELTGKPISLWHRQPTMRPIPPAGGEGGKATGKSHDVKIRFIGIDLGREELLRRIEARCRTMLKDGMIEETQRLLALGYPRDCPALTGLGYPRILSYLQGTISQEECLRLLIQDTRQYAKRQMTWFRHQLPVTWNAL